MTSAMSATTVTLGVIGVALSIPAFVMLAFAALKLFRFVAAGKSAKGRVDQPFKRLGRVIVEVFGHTNFWKTRPLASVAHLLVMVGFLGGIVVWFEAFIQTFNPAGGWPWLSDWPVYHFVEEVLGVGTVLGITALFLVRLKHGSKNRESRFFGSIMSSAWLVEAIVFIEGLGMLLVKASKIATFGGGSPVTDFVSIHIARVLPDSPVLVSAFALFKLISGLLFLVLLAVNLNWGILWHRFTAFFNIYFQTNADGKKAVGKLKPMTDHEGNQVTLDAVEDDTPLGVGTLNDASWKMLLDTTACTECGRCQDLCPAWNTEKPLSPKLLMMDLRDAAVANASTLLDPAATEPENSHAGVDVLKLVSESGPITDDVLWSCTNCGACVDQCPVDIEHLDHIADLRRFQVLTESEFPSELQGMFSNIETKGNPWGRNNSERAGWVEEARRDGIEVPVFGEDVEDFSDSEYLFWVGCAGAYDEHGKKTTRAVVDLLHTAGVKYTVLSTGETCTGDPARRAGNEFLFQMQAAQNIETLDDVFDGVPAGQRKIITTCPHCFNTIRNEYPDFDGHYDVFHHTQLLNRLVRDKWLTPVPRTIENRKPITYHDPCFLGRHNQVYDPPRELLDVTGVNLVEMNKSREEAFCCGAGGAQMFMEENIGRRVNEFRTEQAMDTGAAEIATACPFCTNMFDGGVKALTEAGEDKPVVQDVAMRLRDSVLVDGSLPTPREKAFYSPERQALTITPKHKGDAKSASSTPVAAPPPSTSALSAPPAAPGAPSGTTPAAPGTPSTPAAPSAPGAPATPGVPSAPAAPSGTTPPAPAAPATPAAPAAPGAPSAPAAPSVPGAPAAPGAFSAPAAPSGATPAAPAAPAVPSAPSTPPAPAALSSVTPPAAPSRSGVPSAPSGTTPPAPAAPSAPSTPPAPSARAVPSATTPPAAPATPSTPPAPAVPAAPGAPVPPSSPAPPAAPSAATPSAPAAPSAPPAPAAPASATPPPAPAPPTTSDPAEDEEDAES